MLIAVTGLLGGVGTSSLAWCIAAVRAGGIAVDLSLSGGLAWAAGAIDWPPWPRPVRGSAPPADLAAGALAQAGDFQGVRLLSGGVPPQELVPDLLRLAPAVVDGACPVSPDRQVWVAPNTVRGLRLLAAREFGPDESVALALRPGGVPLRVVRQQFPAVGVFGFRWQRPVRLSLDLGYGVPAGAHLQRVAAELLAAGD